MSTARLLTAVLLSTSASIAFAAPPAYLALDHSSATLIGKPAAMALWNAGVPAKMFRLYPVGKWGFVSEVEGGFDDAKLCIVTARAMMLPRSGKVLVFQPAKTATAFGTQAGASETQCQALAKAKLTEAIGALRSALVPR
ncbi:MAG: hypothetical protein ABI887_02195 [Burkholderiales bacterium]